MKTILDIVTPELLGKKKSKVLKILVVEKLGMQSP